ncbi:MAG: acetoacetate--CoA ligase [Firmicutes bacterium]|nr:acetoacetate--CoA ligase [Alicyclobacillaceae bacterium]MCL6498225.1 acetoacetate--CoA ligase [Bacillota bacterium]
MLEAVKLWEPSPEVVERARVTHFLRWLDSTRHLHLPDYFALWRWSVTEPDAFWLAVWEYFDLGPLPPGPVLARRTMPGAEWFPEARMNFVQQVFRRFQAGRPALWAAGEEGSLRAWTWDQLATQVANLAHTLKTFGVQPGDRVAAYLPNLPETVVGFLATASLGAIWSVTSPEFGTTAVVSRFQQIAPKVLLAADGYRYNQRVFDRRAEVAEIRRALPSLEATLWLSPLGLTPPDDVVPWETAVAGNHALSFADLPFNHPLWIVYSSGTTGLPKPIVHSHGGIVLEEVVNCGFQQDLGPGDRFFWFSSTSWIIWYLVVSALLVGSEIVLYDGSPVFPEVDAMWALAAKARVTSFGTSAAYLGLCQKADIWPGRRYDYQALRAVTSTGSPLGPEGFRWVYERVKPDVWMASGLGGTDIAGVLVGGVPVVPVWAGEIQAPALGVKVEAWGPDGKPVPVGQVGELVVTAPMPSMPLYFWNDPDMRRYRESYFEPFPGVWRQGDWIAFTEHGGAVVQGRSDSTINRQGVRMGTSEIYRVVEAMPEIADSLAVDLEWLGRPSCLALFVVPRAGKPVTPALAQRIRERIRTELSPRVVPDAIYAVDAIPHTLNGKKVEVPIKRLLLGTPRDAAINLGAITHPETIAFFEQLAQALARDPSQDPWRL